MADNWQAMQTCLSMDSLQQRSQDRGLCARVLARFRAAYAGRVEAMTDRSQWPEVDLGFKVYPPLLGRAPGRPKVQRRRSCLEKNANKKKVQCSRCKGFGHFAKTSMLGMVGEDGETAPSNKR